MALSETAQELIDATAEARETIRRAHEATKDLLAARQEARRETDEIRREMIKQIRDAVQEVIKQIVSREIEGLSAEVKDASDYLQKKMFRLYDHLTAIMMGEMQEPGHPVPDIKGVAEMIGQQGLSPRGRIEVSRLRKRLDRERPSRESSDDQKRH